MRHKTLATFQKPHSHTAPSPEIMPSTPRTRMHIIEEKHYAVFIIFYISARVEYIQIYLVCIRNLMIIFLVWLSIFLYFAFICICNFDKIVAQLNSNARERKRERAYKYRYMENSLGVRTPPPPPRRTPKLPNKPRVHASRVDCNAEY